MYYICKICRRYIVKNGFGSHLKNTHNINSKAYYGNDIEK